jgi:hypothetical protein
VTTRGLLPSGLRPGRTVRLGPLEVGQHGLLQGLARAENGLDVALLGAVQPAAQQQQFGEPVDVVERSPKIVRENVEVGGERIASVRLPGNPLNQVP